MSQHRLNLFIQPEHAKRLDELAAVRVAFALDCCDREVMSWVATTKGIDAGLVGDLMMQAVEYRFGAGSTAQTPIEWLSDNGSCYTAIETRAFAKQLGLKPRQNAD